MCYRWYPFIQLDEIKKGLVVSSWIHPISGEPRISVSLLYCVILCFIFTIP
jgi:hypothetical protein